MQVQRLIDAMTTRPYTFASFSYYRGENLHGLGDFAYLTV